MQRDEITWTACPADNAFTEKGHEAAHVDFAFHSMLPFGEKVPCAKAFFPTLRGLQQHTQPITTAFLDNPCPEPVCKTLLTNPHRKRDEIVGISHACGFIIFYNRVLHSYIEDEMLRPPEPIKGSAGTCHPAPANNSLALLPAFCSELIVRDIT